MKTFTLKFSARKIGALGIFSNYTRRIKADSKEKAILKLYEEFDHISFNATAKERNQYFH